MLAYAESFPKRASHLLIAHAYDNYIERLASLIG